MIYLTSDWHMTPETIDSYTDRLAALREQDTLIHLGDLCNDWTSDGGIPWFCRRLEKTGCRILLLDGNHEDMNYLDGLKTGECCKAKGHWVGDRLFHVARGEVLTLEGKTFLTLGGGYSGEGYIGRHPDLWQPRETPSAEEMDHMLKSCAAYDFSFDYIVSHAAPLSLMREWGLGNEYNSFHAFLDGIRACTKRKRWYFGHHHRRAVWEDSFEILYQEIKALDEQ